MNKCPSNLNIKFDPDTKAKIASLLDIYANVPPTCCLKTSCADWCCSKLDESKDKNGNFMSLPLIYNIEYYAISRYIYDNFNENDILKFTSPVKESSKCVFRKSGVGGGCMVYPVRPFSCRVYGRIVPDVFWSVEYPEGSAKAIFCKDCMPEDIDKEKDFVKNHYVKIWDKLKKLSENLKTIPSGCESIFNKVTGINELFILGWNERNELLSKDKAWFNSEFKEWWNTYSELF